MRIKTLLKPVVSLAVTMSVVLSMGAALLADDSVPVDNFDVGDIIEVGTVIRRVGPAKQDCVWIYETEADYLADRDSYVNLIKNYETWTADDTYLVIDVLGNSLGSYYDIYVIPVPDTPDDPDDPDTPDTPVTPDASGSASASAPSLTAEQLRQLSVNTFVEGLYERILGRTYDVAGRDYWVDLIINHGATGADVVRGFLSSEEYDPADRTEDELVLELYSDLYNRIPSAGEAANWTGALKGGASRDAILDFFLSSPEWNAICAFYCVNF